MPQNLKPSKFTRGEKCIFTHLVITFSLIIAVVITYLVHVCLVKHEGNRVTAIYRSQLAATPSRLFKDFSVMPYRCVGAVHVRIEDGFERNVCGCAAVRASWSLVPARCVVARANPHLSHLLPYWTLKFDNHVAGVRRGAAHPDYEMDGADADIGLFEHEQPLPLSISEATPLCPIPDIIRHDEFAKDLTELFIVGWKGKGERIAAAVNALSEARCSQLASPVAQTTEASLCLTLRLGTQHLPQTLLGAMVFESAQLIAVYSWGDGANNSLPIVAIDIAPYRYWIETTIKLLPQSIQS